MRLTRAFVAVTPPAQVLDAIAEKVDALPFEGFRVLPRSQWHLTVAFLGPVEDAHPLIDAVGAAVAKQESFALGLGGIGAFASARRASVVWVGVRVGTEPLVALERAVRNAVTECGHVIEDRPFRAHLTVARAGRGADARGIVTADQVGAIGEPWPVERLVLFESRTLPTGAVYECHAELPLRD